MNYEYGVLTGIPTRERALEILKYLREIADEYGVATAADLKDICGLDSNYRDNQSEWSRSALSAGYVAVRGNKFSLILPKPDEKDTRVSYRNYYSTHRYYTAKPANTSEPVYIVINSEEVEDMDNAMRLIFEHLSSITDREVHITIT